MLRISTQPWYHHQIRSHVWLTDAGRSRQTRGVDPVLAVQPAWQSHISDQKMDLGVRLVNAEA